jgi:hypothetical protein
MVFCSFLLKYLGQEERYRIEVDEQYELADFLLNALKQKE